MEPKRTELELLQEIADTLKQKPLKPTPIGLTHVEGLVRVEAIIPQFLAICSFGGAITFAIIPTIGDETPIPHHFGPAEVRTFLSLAWLFFVFAMGFVGGGYVVITFRHQVIKGPLESMKLPPWVLFAIGVFCLCFAFIFLSLVVVAYTLAVGWVSFGFTCVFVAIAIGVLIMDTIKYRRETPGSG
jgi:MFS family permease